MSMDDFKNYHESLPLWAQWGIDTPLIMMDKNYDKKALATWYLSLISLGFFFFCQLGK